MTTRIRHKALFSALSVGLMFTLQFACSTASAPTSEKPARAQKPRPAKNELMELGRQHKTASDLYRALKEQAKGGQHLVPASLPDWSGVYTRKPVAGFTYAPDQPPGGSPTAKLTPEFQAKMLKRIEDLKKGVEWDPISACAPPGHPRWLTEPFLREFIVTPDQQSLVNALAH